VLNVNTLKNSPGPSELNVTPHFVGSCNPSWDVRAKGVMAGFTPGTTKYHIYKAIHEGIACELAINTEVLDEVLGEFNRMNIAGGNSRIPFTVQLRADLTGKEIGILKNDEAVCLGAAILAGVAVGIYKDAADAVRRTVRIEKTVFPDINAKQQYKKQLDRYKVIYPALGPYREI
jgi:xylulokinase